ncbi:MAG TPA: nitroreductase family protein, partial [Bacillota bacterium]|nr:nitroreductase family protein [Bacillota bacterium]
MRRKFNYDIMPEIKTRWSPRAFSEKKVSREDLLPLFEAARYAPSCFNEQPWRYILALEDDELDKMREILTADNRLWAGKAPALLLVLA